MREESKIFHESWYRIANQHISLRNHVQIVRQMFRGGKWYVIHDPFSNQFYRLTPTTYKFISRLNQKKTVEEIWQKIMDEDPTITPTQGEVIELLSQLYHANMLHYNLSSDSAKLFERYTKKKERILKANLMNIMFFRVPLFDPDNFLKKILPFIKLLISPIGAALWLFVAGMGIKLIFENFSDLKLQDQGILAPSNFFLLYIALVIIKSLHEFGHAFAVRRFGGEVHVMGVMFLIFSPLPYTDTSSAWVFRNKWQRILVDSLGVIFEVFIAGCAIFVWTHTGEGVIHSLAYNIIFVASISTILVNANPLMRFDGYYILSDILDVPNLQQKANEQIIHLVEYYAFGCKDNKSPSSTRKEAFWLTMFGVTSGIYKIVLFFSILLVIADRFLILGMIMAAVCGVMWLVIPFVKLIRYLFTAPQLHRTRLRSITISVTALGLVFSFLSFCPFYYDFRAPGVLKAIDYSVVVNKTEGYVKQILITSGTKIKAQTPIIELENPELLSKLISARAALEEAEVMYQKSMYKQQSDIKPLEDRIRFLRQQIKYLEDEKKSLIVKADIDGKWISPNAENFAGTFMSRGTTLGEIVNEKGFYFLSVISEKDLFRLFAENIRLVDIKLAGESEIRIPVKSYTCIPMEKTQLPSLALGWAGGGDVAIDVNDQKGVKTAEPFYEVRAIVSNFTKALLLHGRSGRIRFVLPPKSILSQGFMKLRQLIQKRYQV